MSTFTVLLVCIQACLLQNVLSCPPAITPVAAAIIPAAAFSSATSCGYPGIGYSGAYPYGSAGPYGFAGPYGYGLAGSPLAYGGIPGVGLPGAYPAAGYGAGLSPYGGSGEGNVAVAGELPVVGSTAVAGQVPIMGAVSFSGPVAAAGAVSISGQSACGCNAPYGYMY